MKKFKTNQHTTRLHTCESLRKPLPLKDVQPETEDEFSDSDSNLRKTSQRREKNATGLVFVDPTAGYNGHPKW